MQTRQAPLILGVLNVTPDSFSDGGRFYGKGDALAQAERLHQEGADYIDIGGESSRPGAAPVSLQEEMDRVLPVIEAILSTVPVKVSVDTRKFEVAHEAARAGVHLINDISAGADIRLVDLMRQHPGLGLLLMHMRGTPQTMQQSPDYPRGVVTEVRSLLADRVRAFREAGIAKERLWVDPGIGFGKTLDHNLELLRNIKELLPIGGRVVCGTSRKSFLAHVLNSPMLEIELREAGTLASNLWAYAQGASVFRVHDVAGFRRGLETWRAIEGPSPHA